MTTKRPRPFFPEGCPQAGPGEAGCDSVQHTFMAAQVHAEGSHTTHPAPGVPPLTEMETDDSRRWSRRSRVQNQQLISPLKM